MPHFCKIQDYDSDFYQQFHIIVCGLDSIVARRWINGMLLSLLQYEEDGQVNDECIEIGKKNTYTRVLFLQLTRFLIYFLIL